MKKTVHIFGGGTIAHVRNHLALCAPAYGTTARQLFGMMAERAGFDHVQLHLTRMADPLSHMETNEDVAEEVSRILEAPDTGCIIFNVALCDFSGQIGEVASGKSAERLQSRVGQTSMVLTPAPKILTTIKARRPDVILVGFKTTADAALREQSELAWRQMEEAKADYVFANDTITRINQLARRVGATEYGPRQHLLEKLINELEVRL